jgi:hypothetical protein
MSVNTPLLLIAWRRPHTLRQVIDAIRPVEPTRLYVACDGPNPERPGEAEKVAASRSVIEHEIDWPCQIERLYSDVNQGCGLGVSRAITWFFEQVEEGIILEDDCIPHPSFFPYCTALLERYRFDTRVWCINGNSLQNGIWRGDGSYYFSSYPNVWGWASWRRCWMHYDFEINQWPVLRDIGLLAAIQQADENKYISELWETSRNKRIDSWCHQWLFTCISNGGLSVSPNHNLIQNIGFGPGASHTFEAPNTNSKLDKTIDPENHPSFILRDVEADIYIIKQRTRILSPANVLRRLKKMYFKLPKLN